MQSNNYITKALIIFSTSFMLCSCSKDKKDEKTLTLYDVPENYNLSIDEEMENKEKEKLLKQIK